MGNGDLKKTVGGIVLAVLLCIVIFFEFRTGFNMVHNRQMAEINEFVTYASDYGKASVSIDEISVYDEVPEIDDEGHVIALKEFDIKVKLNGEVTDSEDSDMGTYTYMSATNHSSEVFTVERIETDVTDCRNAVKHFWYGNTDEVAEVAFNDGVPEDVQFYQCTYRGGNTAVVYSESERLYKMIVIGEGEFYLLLSAPDPFVLTYESVTSNFDDPTANPQNYHTYSKYEEWATAATLLELKEREKEGNNSQDPTNPYKSSEVAGTSATYTSKADDAKREQMSKLGNVKWKKDGTSDDSDTHIDITSEQAQKSKWTLTETTYSYESSGLKIYALSGSRSAESFSVEGTIQNTLNAERPYVVMVKYLDSNNELLGVSVIDRRSSPLKPEGVDKFSVSVTPAHDKIDIQRITAVMFEVY